MERYPMRRRALDLSKNYEAVDRPGMTPFERAKRLEDRANSAKTAFSPADDLYSRQELEKSRAREAKTFRLARDFCLLAGFQQDPSGFVKYVRMWLSGEFSPPLSELAARFSIPMASIRKELRKLDRAEAEALVQRSLGDRGTGLPWSPFLCIAELRKLMPTWFREYESLRILYVQVKKEHGDGKCQIGMLLQRIEGEGFSVFNRNLASASSKEHWSWEDRFTLFKTSVDLADATNCVGIVDALKHANEGHLLSLVLLHAAAPKFLEKATGQSGFVDNLELQRLERDSRAYQKALVLIARRFPQVAKSIAAVVSQKEARKLLNQPWESL